MKKLIFTGLAIVTTLSASAQLFSPEALNGALMGTVIGGISGGNCHDSFSGNGAAIGAGIGLAVGAIAGEARRQNEYNSQPVFYQPAPAAVPGYGYTSPYVYYAPNNYSAPGYHYQPARPNYAVGGTLLGAASGALIGQGYKNPGEGAAIGAGAGLVLGAIAEHAAQKREKKAVAHYQVQQPAPAIPPDTGLQTEDSASQITSKPCPTSTYYWTSRPQISDAPSVPDAPTF